MMWRLVGVMIDDWDEKWYDFKRDDGAQFTVYAPWFWTGEKCENY